MVLILLFTALQVSDICTTMYILKRGGRELNPIMRRAMEEIGVAEALIFSKVALVAFVWYFVAGHPPILMALCAYYSFIVGHNFYQVRKSGS